MTDKQDLHTVNRFDNISINDLKLKETAEGYLEGYAVSTRTGVFPYRSTDGSIHYEARFPEDVFHEDAINSLKMMPIVDNHPKNDVNADSAKELSVGMTGQDVKRIDSYVAPYLKITDSKAVEGVKNKSKAGLSWGYTVDLIKESGIYKGERYDYIQKNIRANHLAIVHEGRAGITARMHTDESDAECNFTNEYNNITMNKIKLDGVEIEVKEDVALNFEKLNKQIEVLKKDNTDMQAKCDALEGEKDTLKQSITELSKKDNAKEIAEKVKARITLEKKVAPFFKADENLSELSDSDLKVKVISHYAKDFKADSYSEDYLQARFDTILDLEKDLKLAKNMQVTENTKTKNDTASDFSNAALASKLINNK